MGMRAKGKNESLFAGRSWLVALILHYCKTVREVDISPATTSGSLIANPRALRKGKLIHHTLRREQYSESGQIP